MSFDTLVTNPGRLRILTTLAVEESQDFVGLRKKTQLTDGNLSSHARRLREAGLVLVEKTFRNGKPVTSFTLTLQGRQALESHVRKLLAAISQRRMTPSAESPIIAETPREKSIIRENTISHRVAEPAIASVSTARPVVRVSIHSEEQVDDLPPEDSGMGRTPRVVRTVVRGITRPVMMERTPHMQPSIPQAIAQPAITPTPATVATASVLPATAPAAASVLGIAPSAPAARPVITAIPQPEEPSDWVD